MPRYVLGPLGTPRAAQIMSILEKAALSVLFCCVLITLLGYLPAVNSLHWFLRVGVPEFGIIILIAAIPASLILAKTFPKWSGALFSVCLVLVLVPWIQALSVARQVQRDAPPMLAANLARYPLFHSPNSGTHKVTTETYKDKLQWDRYTPSNPIKARLLFVHGGSWRKGTREDYPEMFEYLADRGVEVVSVTYRLSGEAPYPAAVQDVESALEQLSADKLPLFIAGRSSGGHLALLVAYRNPQKLAGVIGFYPPVDMVWSYEHPSNPRVLDSQEAIVQFMTGTPKEKPELYKEASPIHRVTEQAPPTLLIHGRADCLVYHRQSEMLSEKLQQKGVEHHFLSLPWTEHGGDITVYGPTGRLAVWAIESFIQQKRRKSGE